MIYRRNNKILVTSSGKLASSCIEYGNDCGVCDAGKTPKYVTVTFSGVSICTDCFNDDSSSGKVISYPVINKSFVVQQYFGEACRWFSHGFDLLEWDTYPEKNCQGNKTSHSESIFIDVRYSSGIWHVMFGYFYLGNPRGLFYGTQATPDSGCVGFDKILNLFTCNISDIKLGYGGICMIQEGDQT